MNEKTVAKVLLKASEILAGGNLTADSDYVYDPEHKNRPHGGGTWYKTEKGWSTNPQDDKKDDFIEKDLIEKINNSHSYEETLGAVKNPNATSRVLNAFIDGYNLQLTDEEMNIFYKHPKTDASVINNMLRFLEDDDHGYSPEDRKWLAKQRLRFAKHPKTSDESLKELEKDPFKSVRDFASKELRKRGNV